MDFAKEKDLDKRYMDIYTEKMEQYWRFTGPGGPQEADDSNAGASESEEEEEKEATEQGKTEEKAAIQ